MKRWLMILGCALILLLPWLFFLKGKSDSFVRANSISYLYDASGKQTATDVLQQGGFQPVHGHAILPRSRVVWLRLDVPREAAAWGERGTVLASSANETVWSFDAYVVANGKPSSLGLCDAALESASCKRPGLEYAFPISAELLGPGAQVLLRVESNGTAVFKEFYFMRPSYYERAALLQVLFIGACLALYLFVALLAVIIYLSLRETSFLVYGLFYLSLFVATVINRGIWDLLLGKSWLPSSSYIVFPAILLTVFFDTAFIAAFFELKQTLPRIYRLYQCLFTTLLTFVLLSLFPATRSYIWATLYPAVIISMVVTSGTLIYLLWKRRRWAASVSAAWAIAVSCNLIWSFYRLDWIEGHWFNSYFATVGRATESFVLTNVIFQKLRLLVTQRTFAKAKEQENRIVRTLFRTLSHDLSNTTQMLSGAAFTCEHTAQKSERQEAIRQISAAVSAQISIIRHAKNSYFNRGQNGIVALEPVRVAECVEQIQTLFASHLAAKKINLKVPPVSDSVYVMAEPISFTHQVLANLVSNAIKFSNPGQTVWLRVTTEHQMIKIEVEDEGIGIPPAVLADLFNEEREVSRAGTAGEAGTGLGMLVVRDFVNIYGGTLSIASERGTRVTILLKSATQENRPIKAAPPELTTQ